MCVAIPPNTTFVTQLTANSGGSDVSIVEIQTVSPPGTRRGDLLHISDSNTYSVDITWRPEIDQQDEVFPFCFIAVNSEGLASEQNCIQLLTGHFPPTPVQETARPHQQLVSPSNTTWHIRFDMNIKRPSVFAFITFHEFDSKHEVYKIDASLSQEVKFNESNMLSITPTYQFKEKTKFYINFERGVVQGLQECGPGSEPVEGKEFWTFETKDVTPPSISFLNNPSVSNASVSISWQANENATWECNLVEDSNRSSVHCSEAYWISYDLNEGQYNLEVIGTDDAANTATVTHAFYVDLTPPTTIIVQKPALISNEEAPTLTFRCDEACSLECKFFSNPMSQHLLFPCNHGRFITPSLQHNGSYTFQVTATDEVGNIGENVTYMWETDFESPHIYGTQNVSVLCTDTSPETAGQAQAVDNRQEVPSLVYHDVNLGCSIRRTWTATDTAGNCLLYTSPSPRDATLSRMPSSA